MSLSEPEMYSQNSPNNDSPIPNLSLVEPEFSRQAPSHYEHASAIQVSPTISRELAKYNMSVSNANYDQQYNDTIGIVMIRTTKGDELTICGCCNIYIGLYFMSFYHLLVNITYFIIGWIIFDFKSRIIVLYILFGVLRVFTIFLGMYVIPNFKNKKLCELVVHSSYKYLTKLWLLLLLISPILCDLAMVLAYIEDNINHTHDDDDDKLITSMQSQKETIIMFVVIISELLASIYFFFVTNTFVSLKWPNLRQ